MKSGFEAMCRTDTETETDDSLGSASVSEAKSVCDRWTIMRLRFQDGIELGSS